MSAPELVHYTDTPLKFDPERRYEQPEPRVFGKPIGFWVSIPGADDWPTWCRDNEYDAGLSCASAVTLSPHANIRQIVTPDGIDQFHHEYSVPTSPSRSRARGIDWRAVSDDYDGIIIAPYQWSRRLGPVDWYYTWDCASGCVWNLGAIAEISEPAGVAP